MELENNFIVIKKFLLEFEYKIEQRQRCANSKTIKIPEFVTIYVYSNENNEPPHFHIVKNNKNDYCLRIDKNIQYPHGHHKDLLTNKQLKKLNNILSENNFETWKEIIKVWNKNNPNNTVKIDLEFKDYE